MILGLHQDYESTSQLQFLLHLDEKFTLGSKFIIQVKDKIDRLDALLCFLGP